MDIIFKTSKLQKICNDQKLLVRTYGSQMAKLMRRRLDDLLAATCLEEMKHLKQTRCHELHGNKAGQLSVDLDHPYRLIFQSANEPVPRKPDGGLDWTKITAVMIIGVEDTHE